MPPRIWGSVMAGVHCFSPPRFRDQEPRRDQRQRLMVMPAPPVADFVVGQARFALGAVQTFFDAMFGLRGASELGERGFGTRVRQVVVGLRHRLLIAISVADHDEQLVVGRHRRFLGATAPAREGTWLPDLAVRFQGSRLLPFVVASPHAPLQHFDPIQPGNDERSLRAVAHIDLGPRGGRLSVSHVETLCHGRFGGRPRPVPAGGSTSRSRIDVLLGTANRFCSCNARKSRRNQLGRPISSSPVIH